MLRDNDLGAALVEIGDDGIAVEGLVGDEALKGETIDERSNTHSIETMAGQENEADEIAQCVGQRQNFGRHAAFGTADGLALRPPFGPGPSGPVVNWKGRSLIPLVAGWPLPKGLTPSW